MNIIPITIESGERLRQVAREKDTRYQPVFGNLDLQAENGEAEITCGNLILLMEAGLKTPTIEVLDEDCRVLLTFDTGESYLAFGFGVSETASDDGVGYFAQFLADAFGGHITDYEFALRAMRIK